MHLKLFKVNQYENDNFKSINRLRIKKVCSFINRYNSPTPQ